MEKSLKLKYDVACKALNTLKNILEKEIPEDLSDVFRDSVIKRFEYSVDTIWKYEKRFLKERYGVEQNSPKSVFRECLTNGILSEEETVQALEMVDARNLTSHTYHEELADDICQRAKNYFTLLETLLERTKPE